MTVVMYDSDDDDDDDDDEPVVMYDSDDDDDFDFDDDDDNVFEHRMWNKIMSLCLRPSCAAVSSQLGSTYTPLAMK